MHLDDDETIARVNTTTHTNTLRLRVQVQLFQPARNANNIAHVSGTKAKSTLTCKQISATYNGRRRLKGKATFFF